MEEIEITESLLEKFGLFKSKLTYFEVEYNIYVGFDDIFVINIDNKWYLTEKRYFFDKDILLNQNNVMKYVLLNYTDKRCYIQINTFNDLYNGVKSLNLMPLSLLVEKKQIINHQNY